MRRSIVLSLLLVVLASGCGPGAEETVRRRAEEVVYLLASHTRENDNLDALVGYVDPVYVRAQGTPKVKLQLGLLAVVAKIGRVDREDVRIEDVRVEGDRATIVSSVRVNGEWRAQKPGRWVRVDGEWYVAI